MSLNPDCFMSHLLFPAELVTLTTGRKLIMFEEHTYRNFACYSKNSFKWICTETGCKAYMVVSINLDIEKIVHQHNHSPPKYKAIKKIKQKT